MLRSILIRLALCAALLPLAGCEWLTGEDSDPPLQFASVSTGDQHTCALTTEGEAYCWGDNSSGQLGLGVRTGESTYEPRRVVGGLRFRSLHAGRRKTCALDAAGALYCWGDMEGAPAPQYPETRFAGVAPHLHNHVCGVTTERTVGCWGNNQSGVQVSPFQVLALTPGATDFSEVSVGAFQTGFGGSFSLFLGHVCGLVSSGAAVCWGNNDYGQRGTGDATPRPLDPAPVAGGLSFKTVRAGPVSTCGLDREGALYCWGMEIGRAPRRLAPSLRFDSLDMGALHGCAVTAAGEAYCWGMNGRGQLGTGTQTSSPEPQAVRGGVLFRSVSAAGFSIFVGAQGFEPHTCGIGVDQRVYCWGSNSMGQLGTGSRNAGSLVPLPVVEPARDS